MTPSLTDLAHRLPDVPAWVEVRALLLDPRSRLIAPQSSPLGFVVMHAEGDLAAVVGQASKDAILEAARVVDEVLVGIEDRAWVASALPSWEIETATVHVRPPDSLFPEVGPGEARFLVEGELEQLTLLDESLRKDLRIEQAAGTQVAASFAAGGPVAFCYAGAITERWWDVSIDTLGAYRRRGHAQRAVMFLSYHFAALGKQPVWCSAQSNPASAALAARLGFVPDGGLLVFSAPSERS